MGLVFARNLADLIRTPALLQEWLIRHFPGAGLADAASGTRGGFESLGAAPNDAVLHAQAVVERANRTGWTGPLLAAARRSFPTNAELYRFAEDFGLTATTADQDRDIRDSFLTLPIDMLRRRLGAAERQVCRINTPGGSGTGFLVGPAIVVTSYSVLRDVIEGHSPASTVAVRFDTQRLVDGTVVYEGEHHALAATDWLVATESPAVLGPDLAADRRFVAVRLAGRPGDDRFAERSRGWVTFSDTGTPSDPPHGPACLVHCSSDRPLVLTQLRETGSPPGPLPLEKWARGVSELETAAAGAPIFEMTEFACVGVHHGPRAGKSTAVRAMTPVADICSTLRSTGVVLPDLGRSPRRDW
jgi:hypothetical protein